MALRQYQPREVRDSHVPITLSAGDIKGIGDSLPDPLKARIESRARGCPGVVIEPQDVVLPRPIFEQFNIGLAQGVSLKEAQRLARLVIKTARERPEG